MAEKTRYSDEELAEFKALILDKIALAKRDYEQMMDAVHSGPASSFGAHRKQNLRNLSCHGETDSQRAASRSASCHAEY